MKLMSLTI